MLQTIVVGVLVVAAAVCAVWALMPASLRRRIRGTSDASLPDACDNCGVKSHRSGAKTK